MKTVRPHKNLIVWQKAIDLIPFIYDISRKFPDEEKFGLTSQLQRAVTSISINVAEGAARMSDKEFLRFAYISSGSISEVDTLLIIAQKLNYINEDDYLLANEKLNEVAALLNGLIKKLKTKTQQNP
jgi:four helix bundle protein